MAAAEIQGGGVPGVPPPAPVGDSAGRTGITSMVAGDEPLSLRSR
jgi:hypothetical protein